MASFLGPPPGLTRPKTSENTSRPPSSSLFPTSSLPPIVSPTLRRPQSASWTSSLLAGLFPLAFEIQPLAQVPQGIQPLGDAVRPAGCLPQPAQTLVDNHTLTNLAVFPAPNPSDPWHIAHLHVCVHAGQACAACSMAFICCSCRALRFTPGTPPLAVPSSSCPRQSRSSSLALFKNIGNGPPPPGFDQFNDQHNDDTYAATLADCDTCDNPSCPQGNNEPATYTIIVEQFDKGNEELYDRTFRTCSACNRSCRKNFLGYRIKSRCFDNSIREMARSKPRECDNNSVSPAPPKTSRGKSLAITTERLVITPIDSCSDDPCMATDVIIALQDSLRILNDRPPTPTAFIATIAVKHDVSCQHPVSSCLACSRGLICCFCAKLFAPAVARHLSCTNCKHIASVCCDTAFCCKCSKVWLPTDTVDPIRLPARRLYGSAGSNTSPEPDIWTPSPRSSPDEIDDLTMQANVPLPTSRSESDVSRAPSRASSVDEPVNVAATPLPTPDYSSIADELVDGLVHPSFPEWAILDSKDKRHFLGRGDLSVTSLKLYARRVFTETTHWMTAGHFLVDIFQGSTLNGSRDDFRHFFFFFFVFFFSHKRIVLRYTWCNIN